MVVAAEGYPDAPITGRSVEGAEPSAAADDGELLCFHGGTRRVADGRYQTAGGRVVTFVGRGATILAARDAAYRGVATSRLEAGATGATSSRELLPAMGLDLRDEAG